MEKLTKKSVNYREATGAKHCGNCSMYRPYQGQGKYGSCTLVEGEIEKWDLCDRWEADEDS